VRFAHALNADALDALDDMGERSLQLLWPGIKFGRNLVVQNLDRLHISPVI
jgi:hypothetical protein